MPRQVTTFSISLSPRAVEALQRITKARFGGVDRRISATIEQLVLEEERRLDRQERKDSETSND